MCISFSSLAFNSSFSIHRVYSSCILMCVWVSLSVCVWKQAQNFKLQNLHISTAKSATFCWKFMLCIEHNWLHAQSVILNIVFFYHIPFASFVQKSFFIFFFFILIWPFLVSYVLSFYLSFFVSSHLFFLYKALKLITEKVPVKRITNQQIHPHNSFLLLLKLCTTR